MSFRTQCQRAEVLGHLNRWFCSRAHGRPVDDPETLWRHYIKTGGAKDFSARFEAAMGELNRWYCSEYYNRTVSEPEVLWDYYMNWDKLIYGDSKPSDHSGKMTLAS